MNDQSDEPDEEFDILSCLRLSLSPEIGPATANKLLQIFGAPQGVIKASRKELRGIDGLAQSRIDSLLSKESEERALREFQRAEELKIQLVPLDSEKYPANLRQLPNPPLVLYVLGELIPRDRLAIAVVGPRKPSDYGRNMTRQLVPPLCARGVTIVSGLAYGIDAEAHEAAMQSGGRTIAVVAQGLDTDLYPAANRKLARRIIEEKKGAVISTFPLGMKPEPQFFPHRNEIIAGFSLGALIIEATEQSGALITASHAAELGRAVMACPGDATRPNARGSNQLITEGAMLIQTHEDILRTLSTELQTARNALRDLNEGCMESDDALALREDEIEAMESAPDSLESLIRQILRNDHRSIDYLLETCGEAGHPAGKVIEKLLLMEMSGTARQMPGRVYCLVESK